MSEIITFMKGGQLINKERKFGGRGGGRVGGGG